MEAGGELVAIEEHALGRRDRAEIGAGLAANASGGGVDSLAEGAELLGVVAVGAK